MGLRNPRSELPAASSIGLETPQWRELKVVLKTPMFGGGVTAGEVDKAMPARVASIRGQLRFWWRIACGPFVDSKEMFARESAVWGGIRETGPLASKVRMRVECKAAGSHLYSAREETDSGIGYAIGPAKVDSTQLLRAGYSFSLHLHYPDSVAADVEAALRWWVSFGGLGARTRRGLGAVHVEALAPVTVDEVKKVGGRLLLRAEVREAHDAWRAAAGCLRTFRQGKNTGRNEAAPGSQSPAGRSRWPEPDALRALSGRAANSHRQRIVEGDFFPRAAFGLPIVFHFKDSKAGDPQDHTLEPADAERMASPLILRPYWNGVAWQPAALLLPGWQKALSQPLKFHDQRYQPMHWPADAARRQASAAPIRPLQGRGDNALSAFMTYFGEVP
jgi:CRISPR-associated protein Cmr1